MPPDREPVLLDAAARRSVRREIALVFAASAAATSGLVLLGRVVPLIGQNVLALVALVFLYLPVLALRRRGLDAADYGLDRGLLVRGARLGLLLTALTYVPFAAGFHLWETVVFEQRLDPSLDNYRKLPDWLLTAPEDTTRDGLYLWRRNRHLVVQWVGAGPWQLELASDGRLERRGGAAPEVVEDDALGTRWRLGTAGGGGEVVLLVREGGTVSLAVERRGEPLGPADVWSGGRFGGLDETAPIVLTRDWTWIPLSLLVQLLLVALPEEVFYRGYLQTRLARLDARRFRLGPFHTSVPILITSLLFAVGHFIIGFDPVRLSVFFPALVFGWLRDRAGGLGATIVFHAGCNLMVELTAVHYWPG